MVLSSRNWRCMYGIFDGDGLLEGSMLHDHYCRTNRSFSQLSKISAMTEIKCSNSRRRAPLVAKKSSSWGRVISYCSDVVLVQ